MSDPGGAAVNSPQGPGGDRARKLNDHNTDTTRGLSGAHSREIAITEVAQAGQDEAGAGAGAVAVNVTPEELGLARVIGQVSRH